MRNMVVKNDDGIQENPVRACSVSPAPEAHYLASSKLSRIASDSNLTDCNLCEPANLQISPCSVQNSTSSPVIGTEKLGSYPITISHNGSKNHGAPLSASSQEAITPCGFGAQRDFDYPGSLTASFESTSSSDGESFRTTAAEFFEISEEPSIDGNLQTSYLDSCKCSSWYQQPLTRSYRAKVIQFQRLFVGTPVDTHRLLVDYSCALTKTNNGLIFHGRMYITENWICFYSKIIYEQKVYLSVKDLISVTKEKTARVFPNAIQITCSPNHERFFFTSFSARDRTYAILKAVWENSKRGVVGNVEDIICQVQDVYGDESLAVLDYDKEALPSHFELSSSSDIDFCGNDIYRRSDRKKNIASRTTKHRTLVASDSSAYVPAKAFQRHQASRASKSMLLPHTIHGSVSESLQTAPANAILRVSLSSGELSESDTSGDSSVECSEKLKACAVDDGIVINFKAPPERPLGDLLGHRGNGTRLRRKRVPRLKPHSFQNSSKVLEGSCVDEGPVFCGDGHTHTGRVYADVAINLNIDALFTCLFTDSHFFAKFCLHRGTFDLMQSNWPMKPWHLPPFEGVEDPTFQRIISYTLSLKQRLGPRTCTAVEEQTILLKETLPGTRYVVDAKVTNEAVPLCNCFHVVSRYCLLRQNATVSRLLISSEVVYDKPVFFGAKSIIEGTVRNSLTDNFSDLVDQLTKSVSLLTTEDRRTGGLLAQSSATVAVTTTAAVGVQNTSPSVTGSKCDSLRRRADDRGHHWHYSEAGASAADTMTWSPKRHNTGHTVYGTGLFSLNTSVSDRNWLFIIALSLLLCVCLSVVYNRYVQLEQLAQRVDFPSAGDYPNRDHRDYSSAAGEPHLCSTDPQSVQCVGEIESIKILIHSLSGVLEQMQKTLDFLEKRLDKFVPKPASFSSSVL